MGVAWIERFTVGSWASVFPPEKMKRVASLLAATIVLAAAAAHGQGTIAFLNPPTVKFQFRLDTGTECLMVDVPVEVNSVLNYGIFIGPSAGALSDQPAGPLARDFRH